MPSNAFTGHLLVLLEDTVGLEESHARLRTVTPVLPSGLAGLNRAVVIVCASAWEAYLEEVVRESINALRPAVPPFGVWSALHAAARTMLGRFHNPNTENVRALISDTLGLADVHLSWHWQNCTSQQAGQRLETALRLRHQIAHGVNPRPAVDHPYARQLPEFFRRLARCTDAAVRDYLVNTLGVANPWPL